MSEPWANGPVPGGGRLVNPASLSLRETQARLDAWFFERLAQSDGSFGEHLLSYVIGTFDNAARVDLVSVRVFQDIEGSYVPYLQSRVDPLLNIVRGYVQQDSGPVLEAYLLKVETMLDARIQHWTAEALHKIGELEGVDSVPSGQSEQPKVTLSPEVQGQSPVNTPANAGKGLDDGKAERRQLRDAYKAECKRHGVTVTDEMIYQEANPNWTDRTAVQKWLACDPRYNGAADAAIRRVLRDKPHLRRG